MTTRIRTKNVKTFLAASVIAAVAASGAVAGPSTGTPITIPPRLTHFQEPGSTGWIPQTTVTIPARLTHFQEPGSTGYLPSPVAVKAASADGFDWTSALVGAGAGLGIALVCAAGLLVVVRRRRTFAHA